jgi:hypothetical protein
MSLRAVMSFSAVACSGHVVRRAEREAGLGHSSARRGAQRQRDAEVRHHRAAIVEQDVLGFDVAVHHPVAVGIVERIRHFGRDSHGLVHAQLLLAIEAGAERLAFDVRHDVVQEVVVPVRRSAGSPAVEQRQDVGVLQRRGGLDLDHEPLGPDHRGELGPEDLDRDFAVMLEVLGQIHRGHAAGPQLLLDAVAVGEGGGEGADLNHGCQSGSCGVASATAAEPRLQPRALFPCGPRCPLPRPAATADHVLRTVNSRTIPFIIWGMPEAGSGTKQRNT